jgi:hypothetical protein
MSFARHRFFILASGGALCVAGNIENPRVIGLPHTPHLADRGGAEPRLCGIDARPFADIRAAQTKARARQECQT